MQYINHNVHYSNAQIVEFITKKFDISNYTIISTYLCDTLNDAILTNLVASLIDKKPFIIINHVSIIFLPSTDHQSVFILCTDINNSVGNNGIENMMVHLFNYLLIFINKLLQILMKKILF